MPAFARIGKSEKSMEYVLRIIGLPDFSLKRALAPLGVFGRHVCDHFVPHARNNYHPHIFGHRVMALFSGLLVTVKIFVLVMVSVGPVLPAFSSAITVSNIINLTNESRRQYGLNGLKENSILDQAAQAKADDMLAKGYFAHNTPDGKTPWDFIISAGYSYIMAGENLAVNFTEAENVETAWMNSPGHRANILNKSFEEIGIGISQGVYQGHEAIFVVQEFGTPAEQKITISDQPTAVQTQAVPPPVLQQAANSDVLASSPAQGGSALDQALSISNEQVRVVGDQAVISAMLSSATVKAIAYFGDRAVMLMPKGGGLWQGQVALKDLAQDNQQVRIKVFNLQNQSLEKQLADFSSSTVANYNVLGANNSVKINWLGQIFDPKTFQDRFYLLFIAGILSSMILAIAIKRHIQHISLIANGSFVVILACLLWLGG